MDPNAALAEALDAARAIQDGDEEWHTADKLAERLLALDEWLTKGGFLPGRWSPATRPATAF